MKPWKKSKIFSLRGGCSLELEYWLGLTGAGVGDRRYAGQEARRRAPGQESRLYNQPLAPADPVILGSSIVIRQL